jgi:CRP/FNR family cyclic AMP-dependent transcriptional regulator
MVRKRYRPGQLIYAQNDPGSDLFKVVSGAVQLSLTRSNGRHFIYCYFGPGDVFGESSLIDGGARPHTAEAKTNVELDVLGAAGLRRLRAAHRDMDDALLRLMTGKMRVLSEEVAGATLDNTTTRVAVKILENAKGIGRTTASPHQKLLLSQSDLASMLGMSRQSVSKVLQRFQQSGAIGLEYGRIQILDMSLLEGAAA